jgi:hypothetical protein
MSWLGVRKLADEKEEGMLLLLETFLLFDFN